MFKLELKEIIDRVKAQSGLSEQEINRKIEDKITRLSGLVSKEGAAHIVANELGVKLFEQLSGNLKIKNIVAGMRNVETQGKVQRKFELREFNVNGREGKVSNIVIGDETGTIRVVMWGSNADKLNSMNENDTISVKGAYVRDNQGRKELHLNDKSILEINPAGVNIGEVKQTAALSLRKQIKDLTESDNSVELLGTVLQVFDPRFFEICPECGKRARLREQSFVCEQHGNVNPAYSYVVNFVLDDGSESIRVVCFRNQVEALFAMDSKEFLQYKQSPEKFADKKTELLGKIIKASGRTSKNDMFNRLEFVANSIDINPNPDEEIKKLDEDIKQLEK